jgi:A1 cistron-splicing factor AAR2
MEAPTIGFLILNHVGKENDWMARKYNPQTEELDAQSLDAASLYNLQQQMEPFLSSTSHRTSVSAHANIKMIPQGHWGTEEAHHNWQSHLTHFISLPVVQRNQLSGNGDKIVPGTYTDEDESTDTRNTMDGTSLVYPPIPCLEPHSRSLTSKRRHLGTQRFMTILSPKERTALHCSSENRSSADVALEYVLQRQYGNDWTILMGEWQLSFVTFVGCSCWSSLEHWRDVIGMLTLVSQHSIQSYPQLYHEFLNTLLYQLKRVSLDVLEDADYSQGHFLLPAIQRVQVLFKQDDAYISPMLAKIARELLEIISGSSGMNVMDVNSSKDDEFQKERGMLHVPEDGTGVDISSWDSISPQQIEQGQISSYEKKDFEEEDNEDGPTMVSWEDVQASMERSQVAEELAQNKHDDVPNHIHEERERYGQTYPLLFAAMMEKEDIVMACARILGDSSDVSLVREAANYLEHVEANRS